MVINFEDREMWLYEWDFEELEDANARRLWTKLEPFAVQCEVCLEIETETDFAVDNSPVSPGSFERVTAIVDSRIDAATRDAIYWAFEGDDYESEVEPNRHYRREIEATYRW